MKRWLIIVYFLVTSSAASDFIRAHEGLRLMVYPDTGGVLTCGYGHVGCELRKGMTITRETAEDWLKSDLDKADSAVSRLVKVPLSEGQRTALDSFVFNLGEHALSKSTLLRKLNNKDYAGAAKELPRWDRANGKVVKGLHIRRLAEQKLFIGG